MIGRLPLAVFCCGQECIVGLLQGAPAWKAELTTACMAYNRLLPGGLHCMPANLAPSAAWQAPSQRNLIALAASAVRFVLVKQQGPV